MQLAAPKGYDLSGAVHYHYGRFPPKALDYERLIPSLTAATACLAKYDALLDTLHNSDLLLAPLHRREAVISSRIEGTVATLQEVLRYEAEDDGDDVADRPAASQETIEVFSYSRAMNYAQRRMKEGLPLSGRLLRETHGRLLFFGRGADKTPGQFKAEQNFVIDRATRRVLFIPTSPERFDEHFRVFEAYINNESAPPLLQAALSHVEFEALHPFKDGNGRLGRMLITLMLWNRGVISSPHFYISGSIEAYRDEYIDRLRNVSANDEWTEWCDFFFRALVSQSEENIRTVERIRSLYDEMKGVFRETTGSRWSIDALDFVFEKPVFRNSAFVKKTGIPKMSAHRIIKALHDRNFLALIEPASGRRAAMYAFAPLLEITSV